MDLAAHISSTKTSPLRIRSTATQLESKITLAVGGIAVVLASVACSFGFFGYLGVSTTMLTIEVIPFLVLAVGVDNIFMLVHTYQRIDADAFERPCDAIGAALAHVGPSILLTSVSECCCFGIGALSNMPAVRTFALYACVAILLDFLLQITAFVALMALDQRRYRDGRADVLCCLRAGCRSSTSIETRRFAAGAGDAPSAGFVQTLFERFYTPALLSKWLRPVVLMAFIAVTCASVIVIPSIEPGFDQKMSMASDSHVVKYFDFMAELLSMGAPVYWVVGSGLEYGLRSDQDLMCGGTRCRNDSIPTQLYIASKYAEM